MYKTGYGQFSPFGTASGDNGESAMPVKQISQPKSDTLRVGVNLVYAKNVENIHNTGLKAMDYARLKYKAIERIAFKWIIIIYIHICQQIQT